MKKHSDSPADKTSKGSAIPAKQTIRPDDRLGADEPLDEADSPGEAADVVAVGDEGHRVRKFEENDEHNNEDLVEEGLENRIPGSKPPKKE